MFPTVFSQRQKWRTYDSHIQLCVSQDESQTHIKWHATSNNYFTSEKYTKVKKKKDYKWHVQGQLCSVHRGEKKDLEVLKIIPKPMSLTGQHSDTEPCIPREKCSLLSPIKESSWMGNTKETALEILVQPDSLYYFLASTVYNYNHLPFYYWLVNFIHDEF
jgi:hypothetical protein